MSREVFIAGQILTAAEMNIVSDQTVMSFAGTASRGSAIASPVEGMTTYIEDSNSVQIYDGSAWKRVLNTTGSILQVVSTVKTDTFSTTSTSYTDVTGLSASITPSSTTSKIMVFVTASAAGSNDAVAHVRVTRAGSAVNVGSASSNRIQSGFAVFTNNGVGGYSSNHGSTINFLDSPATASSVTYAVQIREGGVAAGTVYIGRTGLDVDSSYSTRTPSNITLMEVAG